MNTALLLILYCVPIVLASLLGGHLPRWVKMTHLRTQVLMSLVAGLMLGIALLHLLPHATQSLGAPAKTGTAMLIGLIAMFLLIRLFHTHDHDTAHSGPFHNANTCGHHDHEHIHEPATSESATETMPVVPVKRIGWAGMFFGMMLHAIIDSVALSSSVLVDIQHQHSAVIWLAGLGTFFAVLLHKPLDAFAITSTMKAQGWPAGALAKINWVFAMACPLGVFVFYNGARWIGEDGEVVGWALAVSAGFFVCIALADILPEVAFHDHDRGKLTTALLLGVGLAVLIESLPGHDHDDDSLTQSLPPIETIDAVQAVDAIHDDVPISNPADQSGDEIK